MKQGLKILVIGDLIVDRYVFGSVSRISPEAPIPILDFSEEEIRPGGAANTAANIASLGARVTLLGTLGGDGYGQQVSKILARFGVKLVDPSPHGKSIVKTRFTAGNHQILRLDHDAGYAPFDDGVFGFELARVMEYDCLVISDYNKGTFSSKQFESAVASFRNHGKPVVVDSKRRDLRCFAHSTVIAPNTLEASNATGLKDPEAAAKKISDFTNSAVALTRGEAGIDLVRGGSVSSFPAVSGEVADVTGAGDAVTCALSIALSLGRSLEYACEFANHLASIAVSHIGTHRMTLEEVADEFKNALSG